MVNNINDFVPTKAVLEVLIGMGEFSKILVFDKSCKLDKEIELDYRGSSFERLPEGKYVF